MAIKVDQDQHGTLHYEMPHTEDEWAAMCDAERLLAGMALFDALRRGDVARPSPIFCVNAADIARAD